MADYSIKRFDRLPPIQATLTQKNGAGADVVIDLTTATSVKFIMKPTPTGVVKVNAAAVIVTAASGVVRYDWATGDTDTVGTYQGEWEITWPGPKKQTVPTLTYHSIEVLADLDNA